MHCTEPCELLLPGRVHTVVGRWFTVHVSFSDHGNYITSRLKFDLESRRSRDVSLWDRKLSTYMQPID